jgi:hypothetical protein
MNEVTFQIFRQFQINGNHARPEHEIWYGQGSKGFGWGTVHHAAGSMRMPSRPSFNSPFSNQSVWMRTFASSVAAASTPATSP